MKLEYDVAVVGAGIAGCMAATAALAKNRSLRVALLDRNPAEEVGKKTKAGWVCGDAVGQHHTDFVNRRLGISYGPPEVENHVRAVLVYPPDMKACLPFEGPGFVLDRPKFARRLLGDALKFGAEFVGNFHASSLIVSDGFVTGVVGSDLSGTTARPVKVEAKIVIDASGISSKLRRGLPVQSFIERELDRDDVEATIRMNANLAAGKEVDPDNCYIYLDQQKAPGGYLWIFPKSKAKVNIGLGIRHSKSSKPLQALFEEWLNTTPLFEGIKPYTEDGNLPGAWPVSVRHQNDCLVANGFMITGDAAWFPNPISAGGIGPALVGGLIAGEVAAEALEAGDVSAEGLWGYNLRYVEAYGKKTAGLEALRIFLQSLSNDDLNYMKHFITAEEAMALASGETPRLSLTDKLGKVAYGIARPWAFKALIYTVTQMKRLNELYQSYPESPEKFLEWKRRVDAILSEVRERFR